VDLIIVRHAEPVHAPRAAEPADPALAEAGRDQARSIAAWLARSPSKFPDRIIASPMRRALETAAPIAAACGAMRVETDDRLAEFDLGAAEYVPLELVGTALRRQLSSALETGRWGDHSFDPEHFRQRVADVFGEIVADRTSRRVVVVCHGGVINSFFSRLLERPHGVFFEPRYTSVSRVHVDPDGTPHLRSLNEVPHLR
jgi:probable phosphoglycerate mutase